MTYKPVHLVSTPCDMPGWLAVASTACGVFTVQWTYAWRDVTCERCKRSEAYYGIDPELGGAQ